MCRKGDHCHPARTPCPRRPNYAFNENYPCRSLRFSIHRAAGRSWKLLKRRRQTRVEMFWTGQGNSVQSPPCRLTTRQIGCRITDMRCANCQRTFVMGSHRPGIFLGIAVISSFVALITLLFSILSPVLPIFAGLATVLSACGVWTNMIDAHSMGRDGRALPGVECKHCHHINLIRPWSV